MATIFDTHRAIQNLKEAGIEESQAEAMVAMVGSAFSEGLATKADVQAVSQDVQMVVQRLDASEKNLGQRIEFESQQRRMEMNALEHRIVLKLGALLIAGLGLLFAALRFIP